MTRTADPTSCVSCGATDLRHYYQVDRAGAQLKCFRCVLRHRPRVRTSLQTALVVGTILTVINQGDLLFHGALSGVVLVKMALTYCVPYLVSTYGALMASRVDGTPLQRSSHS
jgi:hypothetical protein